MRFTISCSILSIRASLFTSSDLVALGTMCSYVHYVMRVPNLICREVGSMSSNQRDCFSFRKVKVCLYLIQYWFKIKCACTLVFVLLLRVYLFVKRQILIMYIVLIKLSIYIQ